MLFLSIMSMNLTAQVNPQKGYIITHENDTIHGTIDYLTDAQNEGIVLSFCYHFSVAAYEHACNLKALSLRRDGDLYTSCSAGSAGCISFRPRFLYENSSQTLLIPSQFLAAVFGG